MQQERDCRALLEKKHAQSRIIRRFAITGLSIDQRAGLANSIEDTDCYPMAPGERLHDDAPGADHGRT